jgi:hypothetical protein
MKLKFKHQKFQEDAAKAVCDVFGGQPYKIFDYQVETRKKDGQTSFEKFTGFRNHPIVPQLTDEIVLTHPGYPACPTNQTVGSAGREIQSHHRNGDGCR